MRMTRGTWESVLLTMAGLLQRIQLRNSQMREAHRARYREQFGAFSAATPASGSMCSPAWKHSKPQTSYFRDFYRGCITQDWLNHWLPISEINLQPSLLSRGQGVELKVPTL